MPSGASSGRACRTRPSRRRVCCRRRRGRRGRRCRARPPGRPRRPRRPPTSKRRVALPRAARRLMRGPRRKRTRPRPAGRDEGAVGRRAPACKPNSVPPPRPSPCRGGATAIYLGSRLRGTSSGLPASPSRSGTPAGREAIPEAGPPGDERDCLALHPVGLTWPPPSPGTPVGAYPTLSPITCDLAGRVRRAGPIGWFAFCCTCRRPAREGPRRDAPAVRGARCPVVFGLSSPRSGAAVRPARRLSESGSDGITGDDRAVAPAARSRIHGLDDLAEELVVDDDAAVVLRDDDAVALADLELALGRDEVAGGGAALDGDDGAAVADAGAEAVVGAEVAGVEGGLGLGPLPLVLRLLR